MNLQQIKIGFIGASKTGTVLANYFKFKNFQVIGFYSITPRSLDETIKLTNTQKFSSIEDLVSNSDLIFITTKDDYLAHTYQLIESLKIKNVKEKFFCHCSGIQPAQLFKKQFNCGSMHPIYPFNNKKIIPEKLLNLNFTLEGEIKTINLLKEILAITQNKYFIVDAKYKIHYHLSNLFLTSGILSLFILASQLTSSIDGFNPEIFLDLSANVIANLKSNVGVKNSLTGPLKRADINTFEKYFTILNKRQRTILNELMLVLLPYSGLTKVDQEKFIQIFK